MVRDPKADWYWPLGALEYQHEIRDFFPEEAEMLGIITILWNRQELALRRLYTKIVASKRTAYVEAIWDRQPTHQARRDLLALALYQRALMLTHVGDSQAAENLIRRCRHMEACDGGSDWCSI